jgi:uncharacterized phage protein gp47/JayE
LPIAKKTYRQIAKEILTQICGGDFTEEIIFTKGKSTYKLTHTPVIDIKTVEGKINGADKKQFTKDADFRLVENSIEWNAGGNIPDCNSVFLVQYTFTKSSGITDVNPGSVVRTIVEAISREMENFYLQLEKAYFSGFLDTAEGSALDLVVSILGIKRKPPQPSSGIVTFGRTAEPEVLAVADEVHLYDGSSEYKLNKPLIKDVKNVEGSYKNVNAVFERDVDYSLAGSTIKFLPNGSKPDKKTVFRVTYDAYREITIPKGMTVATAALKPEDSRLFRTTAEALLTTTIAGKWEAELPVISTVPGSHGNVLAGSVNVMPQPLPGVEYVINKGDITNGVNAEVDDELRERAKHALEFAGKATSASLESAIKSVEGVRSLLVEDMPDDVPGIVKVIVDGGDMDKIVQAINDTRAAGIKIEVSRPEIVYINVSLLFILKRNALPEQIVEEVEKRIRSYISTLGIGADVLYSRIVEAIVGIEGVWDVDELFITAQRGDDSIIQTENENIEISNEERAEPRNINISYEKRSKE